MELELELDLKDARKICYARFYIGYWFVYNCHLFKWLSELFYPIVQNVTTRYIMKCDDDTFVRVDTVLKEIEGISPNTSLYMGNLNLLHRPLRSGKWAVTYEEWPEEVYPPYANGLGYIISSDIAKYVVSQHGNRSLRLFKMEDVSMGMWVEQFNGSMAAVQYSHNLKFCQYGCMENNFTAHYQSLRQMICLWDKLARGRAQCCNFR
ncbi:hydroxyproline O-galactosyltransferase GALT2-like [Alnus glutinosa]|uniref:hydroxyproline O-galactosyltransferase GALT2-like n=1 Tax=Alnus glutinosa TaxID=3517 RepID=UPI002D787427|nr:hydroxyproline O-galactosyltransferase GALT2-like [Alnus glutinosa]